VSDVDNPFSRKLQISLHMVNILNQAFLAWRGVVGCTFWLVMWRSWVWAPSNVSLSKNLYPYCLVLVGCRNGFER